MNALDADLDSGTSEVLWRDTERVFCRLRRGDAKGDRHAFTIASGPEAPMLQGIRGLLNEYELRDHLDAAWALRPIELVRDQGQAKLFVEFSGGLPLDRLIRQPMEVGHFLHLAVAMASALGQLHGRGLIHKDIKPANVVVDPVTERVWLTGFGIASRVPRERQAPEPPEFLAGTLAYMAPEQTGRVNRSIDSRSDLYSLGVTFYEMLTGALPFSASDPMEWVHCHVARQPRLPSEQVSNIPRCISAVTMKLLAKTAEERYQTAAGVEADLRHCLAQRDAQGYIADFQLGKHDVPDRLMLPERLYGRDREIETLLTAFDRVVEGGKPELVLVSGYSGIGKSAVVNELHKPLVPPRGLFASGKFDQYKRDIPYATFAQALQSLIRPLLSKNEEELGKWRNALREALDANALLIVELVPELAHVIGEQPPVPDLPPQEAQRRFHLVAGRFIGVFARPEHPLALFLDDLQWLDAATLDLLEDLLTRDDLQHLLLIGAYRDNEVNAAHPLMRKLAAIRQAGAAVQDILLTPLARNDLRELLVDALHCKLEQADPLADLIHDKTTGNPFFAIQFVSTLADEGLLTFEYGEGRWRWDLNQIHAKGFTDNVVELMVGKLNRLPVETQGALQQFACLGNSAEFEMLRIVSQGSLEDMHDQLFEAVRLGLVYRSEIAYRFLHDRVQEAAYSTIPKELRAESHLRLGMLLAANTPPAKREEAIFEIVNQLNRGSHLISSIDERELVAGLNLVAGRRAKGSTAYASALKYLRAGNALLTEESWISNYELTFAMECVIAECELLTADSVAAENRLLMLVQRANCHHDICVVTRLQLTLYTTLDRSDRGVDVFLGWLRREGTVWSNHPTRDTVMCEYERIWELLGSRQIEDLVHLPLITDPVVLDTLDVFTEIVTPAFIFDEHLASLIVCRLVTLSLEHGNCDASCFAYVWIAMFAGPRFDNYKDGFRFGQLGCNLVETRGLTRYKARTYVSFGANVSPWGKHVASGRELVRRAVDAAYRIGDLTFAAYSRVQLVSMCLAAGDSLAEVQTEAESGLAFGKRASFGLIIQFSGAEVGLIRTLRGLTPKFGCMDDGEYSELDAERAFASNPNLATAEFWYWTRKLQARYFAGDYVAAVHASRSAQRLYWTSGPMFETAEFHLYSALAHVGAWDVALAEQRQQHCEALAVHLKQIEVWAELCPENFENRAALVSAERARIEGRVLDAEKLYEEAIRSAHTNGFVHNEALSNELAGRFYAARGFEKIANVYLRDARSCYLHWGAGGKARQLEQRYPYLRADRQVADPTTTTLTSADQLDLTTVIKVSEEVSGEIVLEKLIHTLMRTAIEYAGATRGLLILPRDDDFRIAAEATTSTSEVKVELRQTSVTAGELPESILRRVLRTRESILLHDAFAQGEFADDAYIGVHHARSVLCLPILKQTRLLGVLYLENNLTPHAFTPARMAILKLLASQASISMENASLYLDLAKREARIHRLVDANIIGIAIWDFEGRILDANDAYLQMIGYEREDLLSGRLRWKDLTPPEWLEREERHWIPQLKVTGRLAPFEKEYFRKDGSRVPVLLGLATLEDGGNQGVAFALDLTERKGAAETLRALHADLAHANRLATMGQLTASIAHEVNQPIGAARNNAYAGLRFLGTDPPDLAEVREALESVVNDTYRASEIIDRIRDQIKKKPPRKEGIVLNDGIEEVIALVRGELSKNRVSIKTELAHGLPPAHGDRVQVQQVMLNLILNAIEAMVGVDAEVRELVISTGSSPSEGLLVVVGDSGPGIAPEDRDRVFESFYTTKAGGVGIGLSICRSIIEAHGGRLWADAHLPRGAVFRFTLPALH